MYVRRNIHWRIAWRYAWKNVLLFTLYDLTLAVLFGPLGFHWLDVPWQLVSIVGVAVSFYVGFKNNSAYARFNEARTLWGGIVNRSRSWSVFVLTNTQQTDTEPAPTITAPQRALVLRQLAWCNALRLHLRRQPELWAEAVTPLLTAEEDNQLRRVANAPAQLLLLQGRAVAQAEGLFNDLQRRTLMEELRELANLQGGCERIKNTPYPRQYAFSSLVFVWVFILILPLGLLAEFEKLGHGHFWLTVPFSVLVSGVALE
ncbi:bestrophin family protein [Hymenobacter sp. 102]|uniref:bestrophin family protein n=1 Tax=Hymenobacter sp. 102 TaxID=3403152 RepID=UPI003CE894AD